jgi:hypothetical protein
MAEWNVLRNALLIHVAACLLEAANVCFLYLHFRAEEKASTV